MKNRIFFWLILLSGAGLRLYYILVAPYAKGGCDVCTIGLMAKHILKGEFPLFFYGQYYLGPLEALATSIFFKIFGIKIQVLYFGVLIFSMLFIVSSYYLGRILLGDTGGLLTMLYAAFPPSFFFNESVMPVGYFIEIPLLGNLLFITAIINWREKNMLKKNIYYILLGVLAGIGVWTHYIFLYYLLPTGIFLFLKEKKSVFFKKGLLTIIFGIIASLPFWIFTVRNNFCTFMFKSNPKGERISYLPNIETFLNHILNMLGVDNFSASRFQLAITIIYLIMFFCFISRRKIIRQGGLLLMFFFFVLAGMYVFYRSHMSSCTASYYLIPVITFIAVAFANLANLNKFMGISLVVLIISTNMFNITKLIEEDIGNSKKNLAKNISNIQFMEGKNINRIVGDDRRLREIEYFSNEEIIGTGFDNGDYFPHEDIVEAGTRVALEACGQDWKPVLNNICKSYKFENDLYFDFEPFPYIVKSIPKDSWRTFSCKNACDRNFDFWWLSGKTKKAGDYFLIDLGCEYRICLIRMFNGHHYSNYAENYKIEVSGDRRNWKTAAGINGATTLFWSGPRIYWRPMFGRIECFFNPVNARYVKLVNIENNKDNPWEINEIFVYEYLGEKPFSAKSYVKEIKEIAEFLNKKSVVFVYADYWPSAQIRKITCGKIEALVPYNTWRPFRKNMGREVYLDRNKAIIIAKEDSFDLENILREFKIKCKKKIFNRYICYYFPDKIPYGSFLWAGTGIAKYSLKDYSNWLYKNGEYEKALKYYPNNYLAYLKCKTLQETRFFPKEKRNISFVNGIEFLGYSIRCKKIISGKMIRIEYFWTVKKEPGPYLSVFVYFIKDGRIIFQNDHKFLFQFPRPLNPLPGERFREVLKLKIPENIEKGVYEVVLGLWDERENKRIYIENPNGKRASKKVVGEFLKE